MAPSGDWRALYPFESQFFPLDELRLHYVDEGRGESLLLVHGNPTWSFYWRNLIQAWRPSYRVVAIDHAGCGLSDKPAGYRYTLAQHTRNLVRFVQELDLTEMTLLAHDWGGAIGLGAAVELPERFARIILFNTGAFPPPYLPWRLRLCRVPLLGRVAIRGLNLFARAALSMATEKPERFTPPVRAGLLAPYDSWSNRVANFQFVRDIPTSPQHPTWSVLARLEKRLIALRDRPVQLIWGMRDWCFTPACLQRFQQIFPTAEVERVEDAGHYVVEDAYERIIPVVDAFLARHPLSVARK